MATTKILPNGTPVPVYTDRLGYERFGVYSLVGGYPYMYIDCYDNVLCRDCAETAVDEHEEWQDPCALPALVTVNWENPSLHCDCGERIESAYAEEDSSE